MEKILKGNKKLIISHLSDNDGIGAAILATLAFQDIDYLLIEIKEQTQIVPFIEKSDYEEIYICDIGLKADIGLGLSNLRRKIMIFDHHISSLEINKYDNAWVQLELNGRKTCGAELFYEYLIANGLLKSTPAIATFVECTRAIDTWEWEKDQNLLANDLGLLFRMIGPLAFLNSFTELLQSQNEFTLSREQEQLIDIVKKELAQYIEYCQKTMIIVDFEDLKAGLVFAERYNSHTGNYLCRHEPIDFVMLVDMLHESVSLRSVGQVDVSAIAKKFGGGGHQLAAGFSLTKETKTYLLNLVIMAINK